MNEDHTSSVGTSRRPQTTRNGLSCTPTLPWTASVLAQPRKAAKRTVEPMAVFASALPNTIADVGTGVEW